MTIIEIFKSEEFVKRIKSFLWHSLTMLIAGGMDILLQTLTDWNPEAFITIAAGLVFAQITKYLNKKELPSQVSQNE